jgi:hypothetical protein
MTVGGAKKRIAENALKCVVVLPRPKESPDGFGDEQVLALLDGLAEFVAFRLCRVAIMDCTINE